MTCDPDRLLRTRQIIGPGGILPFGRTTFYKLIKMGLLPPPIKLGRVSAWRLSDLMRAIQRLSTSA